MNLIDLQKPTPVFSKIYNLGEINGKLTFWVDENLGERIQLEFLPLFFTTPVIFSSINEDFFEDALFNFEMDRRVFLEAHYPEYYAGILK